MRFRNLAVALALLAAPPLAQAQIRIAIIGDSLASGEGNPDGSPGACYHPLNGAACAPDPVWLGRNSRPPTAADDTCHRSTKSGLLRAAEQLRADLFGIEPVIIETFACTGAAAAAAAGQLASLASSGRFRDAGSRLFTGDRIDAIVMAFGANDMGFSNFATSCSVPGPECHPPGTLGAMLDRLPPAYAALNTAITSSPVLAGRVGNVFIVEYHQPSRGPDNYCGGTIAAQRSGPVIQPLPFDLLFNVSWFESRFVTTRLVPGLNAGVAAAAKLHGWKFVGGIADRFLGHGHCAATDRWVLDLEDSLALQRTHMGVFHPSQRGHDAYRDAVRAALQPYVERLAAPTRTSFRTVDLVEGQGGVGPLMQVATFALSTARPSARAPVPLPPGLPGDGAGQRVTVDRQGKPILTQVPGIPGPPWLLAELPPSDAAPAASSQHWVAAARRCNSLRCSAWAPSAIAPAVAPHTPKLARTSGNLILATWPTHGRNGAYQVAVPVSRGRWKVYDVAARNQARMSNAEVAARDWEESLPVPRPQGVLSDNRPVQAGAESYAAKTSQFFVRGCNQGGCSEWIGAADYVNTLARPVPGVFRPVPGQGCAGGGSCAPMSTGHSRSTWPAVAGASVYQILAYLRDAGSEKISTQQLSVMLPDSLYRGLRVRACNVAGCSDWSEAVMIDAEAEAPPPPVGALEPPVYNSRAPVTGAPPSSLPPSTL